MVGITTRDVDVVAYSLEHEITFPIYADTSNTFRSKYNVAWLPYVFVVGASGIVEEAGRGIDLKNDKVGRQDTG